MKKLILASASPRRSELLRQAGVCFHQVAVDVDETPVEQECPLDLVKRLAIAKAETAKSAIVAENNAGQPDSVLFGPFDQLYFLGADTLGVLDGKLLLKPRDYQHELEMLTAMSARGHTILTAVALIGPDFHQVRVSESTVYFRAIAAHEIERYWLSGEPQDKAGGYAIQGRGAVFVSHLIGSYSGVVGLPIMETAVLLEQAGLTLWADNNNE